MRVLAAATKQMENRSFELISPCSTVSEVEQRGIQLRKLEEEGLSLIPKLLSRTLFHRPPLQQTPCEERCASCMAKYISNSRFDWQKRG